MKRYRNKQTGEFYNGRYIDVEDKRIFNPTIEILLQAGYEEYEEVPSPEQLLEEARQKKISEIEAYDSTKNVFKLFGKEMWLDAPTRQQLRISLDACQSAGMENVEKWFDGQKYEFPLVNWYQMLIAIEVYASQVLNVTESHKAAVRALTDIQQIEDYDITTDYPSVIEF